MFSILNIEKINFSLKNFFGNKKILFIDDDIEKFDRVRQLKNQGYDVDELKDLDSIDSSRVKRADLIFVDFNGVGTTLSKKEQGVGIIKMLRSKYKNKKKLILFSSYSLKLDMMPKEADDWIAKDASLDEFIEIIQKYI